MGLNYGSLFMDRWKEVNPAEMQAHWADELGYFDGATIGRAIKALDNHPMPPTLPEFKSLCKAFRQPIDRSRQLGDGGTIPTPEEATAAMSRLREITGVHQEQPVDYRKWARDIVAGWKAGTYKTRAGYEIACVALEIAPEPAPLRRANKDAQYAD